jgi:hypothetical protein
VSAWLALLVLAISLGMVAFTLASVVTPGFDRLPDRPDPIQVIVVLCTFVTLPSVGAVLAILRPLNPIGWLFLIASVGFTMSVFSTEYVTRSTILGANLPAYAVVDWIGAWAGSVSLWLAIVFIPIVFPDGHPLGPRWRLVAGAALIAFALTIVAQTVQPTGPIGPSGPTGYAGRLPNPIAVGGSLADIANAIAGLPLLLVFGILAAVQLLALHEARRGWQARMAELLLGGPRTGRDHTVKDPDPGKAFPGGEIYLSMPGLGDLLAARVAGEIGEHITQFDHPAGLQCYAGSAPVTRRSGKSDFVVARRLAHNHYLGAAVHQWAFCSLRPPEVAQR